MMDSMNNDVLIFRADGNNSIGSGHIMRCISIADAARKRGLKSIFLNAGDEFRKTIESHQHVCKIMYSDYKSMIDEIITLTNIINNYSPIAFFLDSYYVTPHYFDVLRKQTDCKLVYIDDMAMFSYDCDYLINYNIYGKSWEKKYRNLYKNKTIIPSFLLGTEYIPLREEFYNNKRTLINNNGSNILVSTGGADPDHFTLSLINAIKNNTDKNKKFHIVVGAMNNDKNVIKSFAKKLENVYIYENVKDMAKLMISCDVAISAAGSTLYELCATRTPTITYVLDDNQMYNANCFDQLGIIQNAGDIRKYGLNELSDRLISLAIELCGDFSKQSLLVKKQTNVVDGLGAFRILDEIIASE